MILKKETIDMNIVFLSHRMTNHQFSISDAWWRITRGNYAFIETSVVPTEQKKIDDDELKREYIIRYPENEDLALQKIKEADIVIAGSASEILVQERVRTGRLLFRYSERPLKNGMELWKFFPRLLKWHWRNPLGKPIYLLCASAYTAGDYAKFGLFQNRAYRWGYFPETKKYTDIEKIISKKDPKRLLWCGRLLSWKHPDDALKIARRLKQEGYTFRLDFIGSGEMESTMHQLVQDWEMGDCVQFLGSMKPESVREHMEKAGIYLFTSGRQEGWGAVLNESMNSACAVVASHAIGSVPFLVKDGENGFVYESGNVEMLYEKIKDLLEHPDKQRRLGQAAYDTIIQEWNAEVAAERLIRLAEKILSNEENAIGYESGPCSKAGTISEKFM